MHLNKPRKVAIARKIGYREYDPRKPEKEQTCRCYEPFFSRISIAKAALLDPSRTIRTVEINIAREIAKENFSMSYASKSNSY